jgi:hypothetical protein
VLAVVATDRALAIHALGLVLVGAPALALWAVVGEAGAASLDDAPTVIATPVASLAAAWYALVAIPAAAAASALRARWYR